MSPVELRDTSRHQPFEPFRLVMTDGVGYYIFHPDLVLVGLTTAVVGLTGTPGQTYFERTVKVDLQHIVRIEPLQTAQPKSSNGAA